MTDADLHRLLVVLLGAAREPKSTIPTRDLVLLVRVALTHEEITSSRAAELLGLDATEMRALMAGEWRPGG